MDIVGYLSALNKYQKGHPQEAISVVPFTSYLKNQPCKTNEIWWALPEEQELTQKRLSSMYTPILADQQRFKSVHDLSMRMLIQISVDVILLPSYTDCSIFRLLIVYNDYLKNVVKFCQSAKLLIGIFFVFRQLDSIYRSISQSVCLFDDRYAKSMIDLSTYLP